MDYKRIYNQLIERARIRDFRSEKYRIGNLLPEVDTEAHHIIPKSIGGTNKKDNIAVLTLREHFIAHKLLCKIHPESESILLAFCIMCNRTQKKKSKLYKIGLSEAMSKQSKEYWSDPQKRLDISNKLTDLYKNPELKAKISEKVKQSYIDNPDMIIKVKEAARKNWDNPEYREKHSKAMKAYIETPGVCEEMSRKRKEEHAKNPELTAKKLSYIKEHMYHKSDEWKAKMSPINKARMNTPEEKQRYRDKYKGSNFDNSIKVLDKETNIVYNSMAQAALVLKMHVSTFRKYLLTKKDFRFKKVKEYNEG